MQTRKVIKIKCCFCGGIFEKPLHHYKEGLKLGYNFYCSIKCLYKSQKNGKILICERGGCEKSFYRNLKDISPHNYCSRRCAALVNSKKYPKRRKKIKPLCNYEKCNVHLNEGKKYCSIKCYKLARQRYSKEDILDVILGKAGELGRTPAKRELKEVSYISERVFGSWNSAVRVAGLEPNRSHDDRMYKREKVRASDGHLCDSISEAIIDDWFTENGIEHKLDVEYPNTHHKADWAVDNGKVFVEYFGLANDSERYDRCVREKKKICKEEGIDLMEIYPKDIYTKDRGEILKVRLGEFGVFPFKFHRPDKVL